MRVFTSSSQKKGKIGEDIACVYLVKHGFSICERNYTKKWGELDIIAQKDGVIHFIEVKSVSRESLYRPEEGMHRNKQLRLMRVIQTYLAEKGVPEWQFDVLCVYLDHLKRRSRVSFMEDIIL